MYNKKNKKVDLDKVNIWISLATGLVIIGTFITIEGETLISKIMGMFKKKENTDT